MKIETIIISSLGEYMDAIGSIALKNDMDKNFTPVLWFRGMSDIGHSLVTTLHRSGVVAERKGNSNNYSQAHYDEDICTQHYVAKNYHYFSKLPDSRTEWLEVMQHHGMRTRLLDWSESSIHSLLFSLECFLDTKTFKETDRNRCTPCVWVLEPVTLNRKVYQQFKKYTDSRDDFITELLQELELNEEEQKEIWKNIKRFMDNDYLNLGANHLDGIFNLSEINTEILKDRPRLKYMLKNGDNFHPFFYLISRVYSDGYVLNDRKLPPLATVQSYHSERIKAQKGVFTVFPFYDEKPSDNKKRDMKVNPDALENNICAPEYLHRIIISDPLRVAYELLSNGMNDSWLYPELPIVSNVLGGRNVY